YFNYLGNHVDMIDWNSWGHESRMSRHNIGKYSVNKSRLSILDNYDFNNHYPAILLPYRDKDEFTMPLQHYYTLEFYLRRIEKLVLIGWKENKAAFLRLLKSQSNKIKKIIIVDPAPKTVEENLKEIISKPHVEKVLYPDFENFVRTGVEKEL